MGRPVKKSKFVTSFGGDTTAKLAVTAYRTYGGSKVDSSIAYIVAQRSSRKFKIHLEDSTEEVMILKAVAPGSLANDNASGLGEFCVKVVLDDSTVAYVEKFYNNTVHYVTTGGVTGSVPYSLGTDPTGDFQVESGKGIIDIVSE
jgi:hypothetical protein